MHRNGEIDGDRRGHADAVIAAIATAFTRQAQMCTAFHAPLYGELCARAADDVGRGGPLAALTSTWHGDPVRLSLPLRVLAGVHALVLAGRAPALAHYYPSVGGAPRWPEAWSAFAEVVHVHRADIAPWLSTPPQTNEVGRSAAMLAGFVGAARVAPNAALHSIELGASAGLNSLWDRFGYESANGAFGAPGATVVLRPQWRGAPPPRQPWPRVASRQCCDRAPLDVRAESDRQRLLAYVWADRVDRLATLRRAIALGAASDLRVERADALAWLPAALARAAAASDQGAGTVVFHSAFWNFVAPADQERLAALLAAEGARRTARDPLFWLRFEDEPQRQGHAPVHDLRLTQWPGGAEVVLGRGQPHGDWIELAASD